MSASKDRGKILWVLWAAGKPMTLQETCEKTGLTPASTAEYLIELIKAEYVSAPQEHYCTITDKGKQALGLPKTDKNLAENILAPASVEKAFHFYYGIDQHSGVYADSLKDFADKIQTIDIKCVEFHVPRQDFELWVNSLGDTELSRKLQLLRIKNLSGEPLRKELYETVNARVEELEKLTI